MTSVFVFVAMMLAYWQGWRNGQAYCEKRSRAKKQSKEAEQAKAEYFARKQAR